MAYVRLLCKADRLAKLRKQLDEEKQHAIHVEREEKIKLSICQRLRHCCIDLKIGFKSFLKRLLCIQRGTCLERTCYKLRRDGSCENYTLKSIVGFISGCLLTYLFFIILVFQLNFRFSTATLFCSLLGIILTIGLAFSPRIRCIVLLTLPQFFSKKGRQALIAYCFMLALTGPARNTLNNLGILSESLACGQEQLKQAVRQILDVIKKPFLAIRDAIKAVVKTVKIIVKKIKEILLKIKRIIMAIVKIIKAAFQFLGKIINICNKELGTPFERCMRVFENAILDCNAKLGPMFSWVCSITYLVQGVCYIVKPFDFVCMIIDFISNSVVGVVIRKVKQFVRHIKTMFYVRIKFSHSFKFQTNASKTMKEVAAGIIGEIRQRTTTLRAVFSFITSASCLFFLFLIFQVIQYRFRYLTNERFDNKYITKDFRLIDLRRAALGKETVLPLTRKEQNIYAPIGGTKLIITEKKSLKKAMVKLFVITIKMCIHMATDYSLFWVMNMIRYYGRFQSKVQAPNIPTLKIGGNGLLADLLRSIVKAFQPMGIQLEIDTVPCLPMPIPPDYDRYIQIAMLLLICWIFTILEPYGLRLRQRVMSFYHPLRAKQRAIWLYNHIMRSRSSFLKFIRRQLRRKIMGTKGIAKVTCREYLAANLKPKWLAACIGGGMQTACLLCGDVFRESDKVKPIRCQTPGCPGVYCQECFKDLQNLCTVCLSPIDYGDISDISEEKDSSEDEQKIQQKKKRWWCKKKRSSETGRISKETSISSPRKKCALLRWCTPRQKGKGIEEKEDLITSDESDDTQKAGKRSKKAEKGSSEGTGNETTTDSTTGETTDYSYSYQYQKKPPAEPVTKSMSFKDAEKQHIPDYASMQSFNQDDGHKGQPPRSSTDDETTAPGESEEATDETSSGADRTHSTPPKKDRSSSGDMNKHIDFIGVPTKKKKQQDRQKQRTPQGKKKSSTTKPRISSRKAVEKTPLLSSRSSTCVCTSTDEDDDEEDENDDDSDVCECSSSSDSVRTSSSKIWKSTVSTNTGTRPLSPCCRASSCTQSHHYCHRSASSSSVDTELKGSPIHNLSKYHAPQIRIPACTCHCYQQPSCKHDRFKYIKYDVVSESSSSRSQPSSSTRSTSSSNKCRRDTSPSVSNDGLRMRKRTRPGEIKPTVKEARPSNDSKQRARDYYKSLKSAPPITLAKQASKGSKIMSTLKNVLKKAKRNKRGGNLEKEEVELKSYNYLTDQWDKLGDAERSPSTSPPSPPQKQTAQGRIRGGESVGCRRSDVTLSLDRIPASNYLTSSSDISEIRGAWHRDLPQAGSGNPYGNVASFPVTYTDQEPGGYSRARSTYSFTIEDLTPTREFPSQMNTTEVNTPSYEVQPTYYRDPPEKDQSRLEDNADTFGEAPTTVITVDTHEPLIEIPKTESDDDEEEDAVSSALSDDYCAVILGLPYKKGKKKSKPIPIAESTRLLSSTDGLDDTYKASNDITSLSKSGVVAESTRLSSTKMHHCQKWDTCTCSMENTSGEHHSETSSYKDPLNVAQVEIPYEKPQNNGAKCKGGFQPCQARCPRAPKERGRSADSVQQQESPHHLRSRNTIHQPQYCRKTPLPFQAPPPPVRPERYEPRRYCRCHENCNCECDDSSESNDESVYSSEDAAEPQFFDLPYQNNDDYLDLVHELEDTLINRNRLRVQKTMREFELRSSQNKNLEKPIFDDDSTVPDEEPILERLTKIKQKKEVPGCTCPCCQRKDRSHRREPEPQYHEHGHYVPRQERYYHSDAKPPVRHQSSRKSAGQQEPANIVSRVVRSMDPNQSQRSRKYPKFKRSVSQTHWELDARSGEWIKVSDSGEPSSYEHESYQSSGACNCPNCYANSKQYSEQYSPKFHKHGYCQCKSKYSGR